MVFRNQRRRTQWPKEKVQIKHTYKSKDRVTRTPIKTEGYPDAPEGFAVPAPLMTPVVLI